MPLKPRNRRIGLLLGLLLLALALPAGASARPFETGVSGIGDYSPLSFERTREAGARYVRLAAYWENIAPKQPPANWDPTNPGDPHYDWSYLDTGVTEAVRQGLKPLLLVDGAPKWAPALQQPARPAATDLCDPDPAALAAFATAAAAATAAASAACPGCSTGRR